MDDSLKNKLCILYGCASRGNKTNRNTGLPIF